MGGRRFCYIAPVLVLICTMLLSQGLPNPIQPPPVPDSRMILEKPPWPWMQWWKFMGNPPEERRAALHRLPPESSSQILRFHLGNVVQRHRRKLSLSELKALSELSRAAEPAAFRDEAARERMLKAEEHLMKILSRPALDEVQELLPPSKSKKSTRPAMKRSHGQRLVF